MKPIKVTTVEQARALPELEDTRKTIDPDTGITTIERIAVPFAPMPLDGDQILFFIDTDGRPMRIVYTPDGPTKKFYWI